MSGEGVEMGNCGSCESCLAGGYVIARTRITLSVWAARGCSDSTTGSFDRVIASGAARTLIYVDGELVKNTTNDHFVYRQRLAPGCHRVEVLQKRNGEVISRSVRRFCSDSRSRLIVEMNDGSVTTTTRTVS